MRDIFIFGGGKWGLALAYAFSHKNRVFVLSRRKLELSGNLSNVEQISYEEFVKRLGKSEPPLCVMAIATAFLRSFLQNFAALHNKNIKIMAASKGIEQNTGAFPNQILESFFPNQNLCYLSGPSFADEVNAGLPCALALHSDNETLSQEYAKLFPDFIRIYVKHDIIGAEIAGAYKNVIAIAAGICDGLKLGNNAKASLLARGLIEMARFGMHFGGKIETFLGLSGSGDLFLTSNSKMSRNYRVGDALSQDRKLSDILEELGEVAEGVYSAKSITQISHKRNIHTPIACEVQAILEGGSALLGAQRLVKRNQD